MQTIALQQVRIVPAWRPALAVARPGYALGQAPPAPAPPPMAPAPAPAPAMAPAAALEKPPFIDSSLVQTIENFTGAIVTGLLAYGATYPGRPDVKPSRWAYVFLSLTAGLAVMGFVQMSRIRER